jgi:hypothetical protein
MTDDVVDHSEQITTAGAQVQSSQTRGHVVKGVVIGTIRSKSDAVTDNNLDSLRGCP